MKKSTQQTNKKRLISRVKHEIPLYKLVGLTPKETRVNETKLQSFYDKHGQFPAEYRTLVWRFVLRLPENSAAFSDLASRGIHSAYEDLYERFPLQSDRLFVKLQYLCSMFAHWSPIFAEVKYLPQLVFPFLLIYDLNELAVFETVATILMWWGYSWNTLFPNPPLHLTTAIDNILKIHDKSLSSHLIKHDLTAGTLAWRMISTMFTEIINRDQWLLLMDYIFLHFKQTHLMIFIPIAILRISRTALLHADHESHILSYVANQQFVNARTIIDIVINMIQSTPPHHYAAAISCCLSSSTLLEQGRTNFKSPLQSSMPYQIPVAKSTTATTTTGSTTHSTTTEKLDHGNDNFVQDVATNITKEIQSRHKKSSFPTYDKFKNKKEKELGVFSVEHNPYLFHDEHFDPIKDHNTVIESLSSSAGNAIFPLPHGVYPVYSGYPKVVIDWELKKREAVMAINREMQGHSELLQQLRDKMTQLEARHIDWMSTKLTEKDTMMNQEKELMELEKQEMIKLYSFEQEQSRQRLQNILAYEKIVTEEKEVTSKLETLQNIHEKEKELHHDRINTIATKITDHRRLGKNIDRKVLQNVSAIERTHHDGIHLKSLINRDRDRDSSGVQDGYDDSETNVTIPKLTVEKLNTIDQNLTTKLTPRGGMASPRGTVSSSSSSQGSGNASNNKNQNINSGMMSSRREDNPATATHMSSGNTPRQSQSPRVSQPAANNTDTNNPLTLTSSTSLNSSSSSTSTSLPSVHDSTTLHVHPPYVATTTTENRTTLVHDSSMDMGTNISNISKSLQVTANLLSQIHVSSSSSSPSLNTSSTYHKNPNINTTTTTTINPDHTSLNTDINYDNIHVNTYSNEPLLMSTVVPSSIKILSSSIIDPIIIVKSNNTPLSSDIQSFDTSTNLTSQSQIVGCDSTNSRSKNDDDDDHSEEHTSVRISTSAVLTQGTSLLTQGTQYQSDLPEAPYNVTSTTMNSAIDDNNNVEEGQKEATIMSLTLASSSSSNSTYSPLSRPSTQMIQDLMMVKSDHFISIGHSDTSLSLPTIADNTNAVEWHKSQEVIDDSVIIQTAEDINIISSNHYPIVTIAKDTNKNESVSQQYQVADESLPIELSYDRSNKEISPSYSDTVFISELSTTTVMNNIYLHIPSESIVIDSYQSSPSQTCDSVENGHKYNKTTTTNTIPSSLFESNQDITRMSSDENNQNSDNCNINNKNYNSVLQDSDSLLKKLKDSIMILDTKINANLTSTLSMMNNLNSQTQSPNMHSLINTCVQEGPLNMKNNSSSSSSSSSNSSTTSLNETSGNQATSVTLPFINQIIKNDEIKNNENTEYECNQSTTIDNSISQQQSALSHQYNLLSTTSKSYIPYTCTYNEETSQSSNHSSKLEVSFSGYDKDVGSNDGKSSNSSSSDNYLPGYIQTSLSLVTRKELPLSSSSSSSSSSSLSSQSPLELLKRSLNSSYNRLQHSQHIMKKYYSTQSSDNSSSPSRSFYHRDSLCNTKNRNIKNSIHPTNNNNNSSSSSSSSSSSHPQEMRDGSEMSLLPTITPISASSSSSTTNTSSSSSSVSSSHYYSPLVHIRNHNTDNQIISMNRNYNDIYISDNNSNNNNLDNDTSTNEIKQLLLRHIHLPNDITSYSTSTTTSLPADPINTIYPSTKIHTIYDNNNHHYDNNNSTTNSMNSIPHMDNNIMTRNNIMNHELYTKKYQELNTSEHIQRLRLSANILNQDAVEDMIQDILDVSSDDESQEYDDVLKNNELFDRYFSQTTGHHVHVHNVDNLDTSVYSMNIYRNLGISPPAQVTLDGVSVIPHRNMSTSNDFKSLHMPSHMSFDNVSEKSFYTAKESNYKRNREYISKISNISLHDEKCNIESLHNLPNYPLDHINIFNLDESDLYSQYDSRIYYEVDGSRFDDIVKSGGIS